MDSFTARRYCWGYHERVSRVCRKMISTPVFSLPPSPSQMPLLSRWRLRPVG